MARLGGKRVRCRCRLVSVLLAACVLFPGACTRPGPKPSVVLVVLDTTRADAVSVSREGVGTTPTLDELARGGLQYDQAYSNANWTLPSHASLFTGLLPSQHGLEGGNNVLDSVPTLAELLSKAGYETIGVNENPWLGPKTGVIRGFDRFLKAGRDMSGVVKNWLDTRQEGCPFFLFVNIMDAHTPYTVRKTNPFLPPGVDTARAQSVATAFSRDFSRFLCNVQPDDEEMAVLRGLYLGDVRAADVKLRSVLEHIEPLRRAAPVIVIVTSDHGEYFGEHSLVEHEVGVGDAVLHVPLIVNGLPGVSPARIKTPVQLVDIMPSILHWIGAPASEGLYGQPLPTEESERPRERTIVAEYHDYIRYDPDIPEGVRELDARKWTNCGPQDRVFGDTRAIIRFPYKLVWYANYTAQLFDLRADRREEHDLAAALPQKLMALQSELESIVRAAASRPPAPTASLDPAQVERLRALGYLGGVTSPDAEGPPHGAEPGAASRSESNP